MEFVGVGDFVTPTPNDGKRDGEHDLEFVPAPTVFELDACRYERWHAIPALARLSYQSVTLDLPDAFVSYLLEDGLSLSAESNALPKRVTPALDEKLGSAFSALDEVISEDDSFAALKARFGGGDTDGSSEGSGGDGTEGDGDDGDGNGTGDDDDVDGNGTGDGNDDNDETNHPVGGIGPVRHFPEVDTQITTAIERLGGRVTPKLTWSAPKDAVWMATTKNTLCQNSGEVTLLLKASDAVAFDLSDMYAQCADVTDGDKFRIKKNVKLHLRKWRDVVPAYEFRLFVRNGNLVGICQRDCSNFYPFLVQQAEELEELLVLFWQSAVFENFREIQNYALDLYVSSTKKVKVVDFNNWGGGTLPLMFDWSELKEIAARNSVIPSEGNTEGSGTNENCGGFCDDVQFRVVTSQGHIRPGAQLGVPFDMYDRSEGGALAQFQQKRRESGY